MGDARTKERQASRAAEASRGHLGKRLPGYAAGANAAGVGRVVAAPAKVDIVYPPADVTFRASSSLSLVLNHDGVDDFPLVNRAGLAWAPRRFGSRRVGTRGARFSTAVYSNPLLSCRWVRRSVAAGNDWATVRREGVSQSALDCVRSETHLGFGPGSQSL